MGTPVKKRYGQGLHRLARVCGFGLLAAAAPAVTVLSDAVSAGPTATQAMSSDSAGMGLLQWAYDRWTVPWVQVRGAGTMLAPSSHATLMVLSCEGASLERDRATRHLSATECEHRMAAVRSDQDTALIFRLDLRVLEFRGTDDVARLKPGVALILEDDRGRRWNWLEVTRGAVLQLNLPQGLRRFRYQPPWSRNYQGQGPLYHDVDRSQRVTVAEHRVRFLRRDPASHELVIGGNTQWIRLRLSYAGHEWVATWPLKPVSARER